MNSSFELNNVNTVLRKANKALAGQEHGGNVPEEAVPVFRTLGKKVALCTDSVHDSACLCLAFSFALPSVIVRVQSWAELGLAVPTLQTHGVVSATISKLFSTFFSYTRVEDS